jgi:hypothetical protein
MANPSARAPVFARGTAVLDYWLARCEGMTVQPLGARVLEVVLSEPYGRAQALVVRSRVPGRTRTIPVEQIVAVSPWADELLLGDAWVRRGDRRRLAARFETGRALLYRLAGGALAAAVVGGREGVVFGRRVVAALHTGAQRLRPHAARAGSSLAACGRAGSRRTGTGARWVAPRLVRLARAAALQAANGLARFAAAIAAAVRLGSRHARAGLAWLVPRLAGVFRSAVAAVSAAARRLAGTIAAARTARRTERSAQTRRPAETQRRRTETVRRRAETVRRRAEYRPGNDRR